MSVERFTVAIESELLVQFDELRARRGLGNRSEAVRELVRKRLIDDAIEKDSSEAVATLTLLFDHEKRELTARMTSAGHVHHAHVLSTLHVHLDDRLCLEVMALRGRPSELRRLADTLIAMKGVKHGQLVLSSAHLWKENGSSKAARRRVKVG
jgi:CopG family transcriptional regulator, nickel-responsive regulator